MAAYQLSVETASTLSAVPRSYQGERPNGLGAVVANTRTVQRSRQASKDGGGLQEQLNF